MATASTITFTQNEIANLVLRVLRRTPVVHRRLTGQGDRKAIQARVAALTAERAAAEAGLRSDDAQVQARAIAHTLWCGAPGSLLSRFCDRTMEACLAEGTTMSAMVRAACEMGIPCDWTWSGTERPDLKYKTLGRSPCRSCHNPYRVLA
jgi:hypothetical protein